ncbi:MAG: hypothetical protein KC964_22250, partial [Candidatus Omnitrophica bacterium]|nr:hypothetical protein [Candidatus Omnitrophota bacterium]
RQDKKRAEPHQGHTSAPQDSRAKPKNPGRKKEDSATEDTSVALEMAGFRPEQVAEGDRQED